MMIEMNFGGGGGTDVSDTTAIESDVLVGKIFHLSNGESAVGTYAEPKLVYQLRAHATWETFDVENTEWLIVVCANSSKNVMYMVDLSTITTSSSSYTSIGTTTDGKQINMRFINNKTVYVSTQNTSDNTVKFFNDVDKLIEIFT